MNDKLHQHDAHVAAQHWQQPWQDLLNSLPIPPRHLQHDCNVAVTAHLVWSADGAQHVDTLAYAWAASPRTVLVQIDDRRHRVGGAWLPPWDVRPRGGATVAWTTIWGTPLDTPPWAG